MAQPLHATTATSGISAELRVHSHTPSILASPALYSALLPQRAEAAASKLALTNGSASGSNTARVDEPQQLQQYGLVAASIALPVRPLAQGALAQLPSLIVWVERAEMSGQEDAEVHVLSLPPALLAAHFSHVEGASRVLVRPHTPIVLTRLFLRATDEASFSYAQASPTALIAALDARIAREGELLSVHDGAEQVRYSVLMAEPVRQGLVCTADQRTKVIITHQEDEAVESSASAAAAPNGTAQPKAIAVASSTAVVVEDQDDLSIDERFLAQSVLDDFASDTSDVELEAELQQPNGHAVAATPAIEYQLNGHAIPTPLASRSSTSAPLVTPLVQQDRAAVLEAISAWAERTSHDAEGVDDEHSLLLSRRSLALVGAFEGDWAVAELRSGSTSPQRIVRLFALPARLERSGGGREEKPKAYAPPMLLQNLHAHPASFDPSRQLPLLSLRPLRSASNEADKESSSSSANGGAGAHPLSCPLPLPFADALCISRIAGPLSINRAYQGLFLEALRTYFEKRRRLVKQGDVIAVGIDQGKVRWIASAKGEGEEEGKEEETATETENVDYDLPSSATSAPTAIIYFRIASLTPELFEPPSETGGSVGGKAEHDAELTLREAARRGHLGCVVEPTLSKMVQTGIDKSRVADARGWLGVVVDTPSVPSAAGAALTSSTSAYGELLSLVQATLLPRAASYDLQLSVLLTGARGAGKRTVTRWVAQAAGVQLIEMSCYDIVSDTDTRTEGMLRARFEQAASCGPAIVLLRDVEALAKKSQAMESGQEPAMVAVLRDCLAQLRKATKATREGEKGAPVAVFATTSEPEKCPTGVLGCFKHEITFNAPNEAERLEMLETALQASALSADVSVKSVATQTAALVAADLVDLVQRAKLASTERLRQAYSLDDAPAADADVAAAGLALTGADFETALAKARASYSESIGAPKIPNVTWDDVGGLAAVKDDILDTIQLPLEHPELFSDGLKKRSGILLYGPPGTGKTLLAKAVATSCSLNFFSVKGPELLNMYIGESEANVRRVFQRARDAKPCVIFFDELDSVAPKRGNQGDSGGVMDRIVSQLLAELDGMAGSAEGSDVFVIGATNRPDLLDPALLRPGRFDRMLYLSVSETHAAQLNILQALTRKFKLDADLGDLSCIAEQCPFNLTGADFYALCSDAMLKAMTRKAGEVDARIERINAQPGPKAHPSPLTPQYYLAEMAKPAEIEVRVSKVDFEAALAELVPSVSEAEMQHYRSVQKQFSQPKAGEKAKAESDEDGHVNGAVNGSNGREMSAQDRRAAIESIRQFANASNASSAQQQLTNGDANASAPATFKELQQLLGNGSASSAPSTESAAVLQNGNVAEGKEETPRQEEEVVAKGKGKGKARE